jgi:large subunit ribosomal protein L4
MEVKVLDINGKETGRKVNLDDTVFAIEPNKHAVYLDVKQYLANQRQGTHKAKEKAEVSYSTRKLKRQKGTGGARAGSRKSGTMIGGGRFFGPRPRNYSFKLNKKLKVLARASALSYKAKDNKITVVENFNFDAPKTKKYLDLMKNLNVLDKKTLLVLSELNKNVYLSARNLGNTKVVSASNINTYDVLNAHNLILSEGSLAEIEKLFN